MPTCKECKSKFPNKIVLNGRQRVLNTRKYCLKCSPFGSHNTVPIHIRTKLKGKRLQCERCSKKYRYIKNQGHTTHYCNSCHTHIKNHEKKKQCVDYKGGKCQKCGYSKCIDVLTFHHFNPRKKKFGIAGNYNRSWHSLQAELDKCILLCLNCHGEQHDNLRLQARGAVVAYLHDKQVVTGSNPVEPTTL